MSDDIRNELSVDEWTNKHGISAHHVLAFFARLDGDKAKWDITFYENPGLKDGHRQPVVSIDHEWFNECTTINIDAARGMPEDDCKIVVPISTDILTHEEDLSIEDALVVAEQRANDMRERHKPPKFTTRVKSKANRAKAKAENALR